MAYTGFTNGYPPSSSRMPFGGFDGNSDAPPSGMTGDPQFDIFEWHPAYQSCQRFFLDHAQHDGSVQAVCALVNICLPFQWSPQPLYSASGTPPHAAGPGAFGLAYPRHSAVPNARQGMINWVSLVPFIRRLVVTGFDKEGILHGFFGDDWRKGIGPIQECERRNYLFAAKSVGWAKVKYQYDMSPHETVPFLRPLQNVQLAEIEGAEKNWSQWLAMEDWMIGPRAPDQMGDLPDGVPEQRERPQRD
ncbi:hypothetical protein H2201_007907 [Coniosporium apollinis]|uniref:Ilp is an apoptosis inhibitor n=2 Tax=Coniosporium TaxID=2810619 RepID=A0ABQ9NHK7_9PEZI|nr:hypothetical protein H2199_004895 [Cladosporium sp. JES 115]KAJ9658126.1 hypothetical protein H2201_007907 [Coniosporium apollinis]